MRRKTVLVWIFICVAVVALIGVIFWKLSLPRKTTYYELWGIFENVAGLKPSDAIRFRGKPIGVISKLSIEPNAVKVRLLIDQNVRIPYGSRLQITSEGLMGTRFLEILPPSRPTDSVLPPGSVLPVEEFVTLTDLQRVALELLVKIGTLTDSLTSRLNAIDPNKIQSLVSETQKAIERFKDVEEGAIAAADSLQALSGRIGKIANGLGSLTEDSTFTTDLKTTASNLRRISEALRRLCFWLK